jgi:hypothetical protein
LSLEKGIKQKTQQNRDDVLTVIAMEKRLKNRTEHTIFSSKGASASLESNESSESFGCNRNTNEILSADVRTPPLVNFVHGI